VAKTLLLCALLAFVLWLRLHPAQALAALAIAAALSAGAIHVIRACAVFAAPGHHRWALAAPCPPGGTSW
jgi:hypothetical protein